MTRPPDAEDSAAGTRAQPNDFPAGTPDVAAARKVIAEAAANPGNTSARNDQRQQARRFLLPEGPGIVFGPTDLTGDVVVGGKTVNYQGVAGRGPRSYPLDAERLAEVRGVFVPPPGYPALVEYCLTHRIVVLRGPHGWGKTTTAISLLDDVACHTLVLLESTADLRRLTAERIATGVGYLLTDIATGQLGDLSLFELRRVSSELAAHEARLVITLGNDVDVRLHGEGLAEHVVELAGRPDPVRVVARQVRWLARLDEEADTILGRPGVAELVEGQLAAPDISLTKLAQAAALLVETRGDVEAVRAHLSVRDEEDFRAWFRGLPDLPTRCFAIALAVLNGQPHQVVVDAADRLRKRIETDSGGASSDSTDPFQIGKTARLAAVRARLVTERVPDRRGWASAQVVSFTEASYAGRLLVLVWHEYDHIQEAIVEWLRTLGGDPAEPVRIRAATAVGLLAVAGFDYLRRTVLDPWADSGDERRREAAAFALDTPSRQPALRASVRELVARWSADDAHPHLQAAAARACGSAPTERDARHVLAVLDRLVGSHHLEVVDGVCQSVAELLTNSESEVVSATVERLCRWARSTDARRRTGGQLAFLLAAADLVGQGDAGAWPSLLTMAARHTAITKDLAELWSITLSMPEFGELAREVLGSWASAVEDDRAAVVALVAVLRAAATRRPDTRGILTHQASRWQRGDNGPHAPRTAGAILHALTRG